MYEVFDHTADLGIRVRAASLESLYEDAARALTEVIAGDGSRVRPTHTHRFDIPGADPAYLLFDWLNEVLFAFESRRLLFARFEVTVDAAGLHAVALGEPYDPARHALAHEVKAITYHALEARRVGDEWHATVIVDI